MSEGMPCDNPVVPWDEQQGFNPNEDGAAGCGRCGVALREHAAEWTRNALADVAFELAKAREIHAPMHSAHEGYAVILEELEELWGEIKKRETVRDVGLMRAEAIQVAAMAVRFVQDVCDRQRSK